MKRRINSTGRKSISQEHVTIYVNSPQGSAQSPNFSAKLTFPPNLGLDRDANVYVEAYVRSSTMRFPFGTVGTFRPPADTSLSEIDHGASVLFRVKVVDESGEVGKIVAAANGIRPYDETEEGTGRQSLLPLVMTDLGEAVWRVHIDGGAKPVLQINNRIPDLRERLLEDPILQGAIYTEALRNVLNALFHDDADDDMEWVVNWKKFIAEVRGVEVADDIDSEDAGVVEEIVEGTIERFLERMQFASRARKVKEEIQND